MPKVDLAAIEETNRTGYPPPFDRDVAGRWYRRLAPPSGITDFGASLVRLEPGAWSSQRHWHEGEDELLVMIEGEAVLVEDDGRDDRSGRAMSRRCPRTSPTAIIWSTRATAACRFLVVGDQQRQGLPLSRHRPALRRADRQISAQGPHALLRLFGRLSSYCSITHGSSWASSIHSTTSARWRTFSM